MLDTVDGSEIRRSPVDTVGRYSLCHYSQGGLQTTIPGGVVTCQIF